MNLPAYQPVIAKDSYDQIFYLKILFISLKPFQR